MLKAVFLAVAIVVVLAPISVSAAPNPALCRQLRKIFDICENYQVKHHLPVLPRCAYQWNRLKKAGCA